MLLISAALCPGTVDVTVQSLDGHNFGQTQFEYIGKPAKKTAVGELLHELKEEGNEEEKQMLIEEIAKRIGKEKIGSQTSDPSVAKNSGNVKILALFCFNCFSFSVHFFSRTTCGIDMLVKWKMVFQSMAKRGLRDDLGQRHLQICKKLNNLSPENLEKCGIVCQHAQRQLTGQQNQKTLVEKNSQLPPLSTSPKLKSPSQGRRYTICQIIISQT